MSSAWGQVIHKTHGAILGYFRYDGTSDVVVPRVYLTRAALSTAWRKEQERKPWPCKHTPQEVWIYSSYGGGFYWNGYWCPTHRMITPESALPWEFSNVTPILHGHPFLED